MPLPSSATTDIGGRYRIEGHLGRGGMAEVRAGTDLRLQRPVAVKFLLPEMAAREDIRRRFEAEACAAASLTDPHAVAVYDTGEHEGLPYIVMERLPGETLADRIATGPQDPAWVRQVATEVLAALGAAHAAGMVHRDVKPGNILITADDHAKIADFGIAKSIEATDGSLDLTGTGQLLGTPAYLPPERLDGGPATAQSTSTPSASSCTRPSPASARSPARLRWPRPWPSWPATTRRSTRPAPGSTPRSSPPSAGDGHRSCPAVRLGRGHGRGADRARPHGRHGRRPDPRPCRGAGDRHPRPPRDAGHDRGRGRPVPPARRPRSRLPLAALLAALVFVALLVLALNRGDGNGGNRPVSAQTTDTTQPAPPTTAARPQTTVAPSRSATTAPAAGSDRNEKDDDKGKGNGKGKDD